MNFNDSVYSSWYGLHEFVQNMIHFRSNPSEYQSVKKKSQIFSVVSDVAPH